MASPQCPLTLATALACPGCKLAKALLDKEGVEYSEIDVCDGSVPSQPMVDTVPALLLQKRSIAIYGFDSIQVSASLPLVRLASRRSGPVVGMPVVLTLDAPRHYDPAQEWILAGKPTEGDVVKRLGKRVPTGAGDVAAVEAVSGAADPPLEPIQPVCDASRVENAWDLARELASSCLVKDRWTMTGSGHKRVVTGLELAQWVRRRTYEALVAEARKAQSSRPTFPVLTDIECLTQLEPLLSHGLLFPVNLCSGLEPTSTMYQLQQDMHEVHHCLLLEHASEVPPETVLTAPLLLTVPDDSPCSAKASAGSTLPSDDESCAWLSREEEIVAGEHALARAVSSPTHATDAPEDASDQPIAHTDDGSSVSSDESDGCDLSDLGCRLAPGAWGFAPPLGMLNCVYAYSAPPRSPDIVARCLQRRTLMLLDRHSDVEGRDVDYKTMRQSEEFMEYLKVAAELQCIDIRIVAGGGPYAKAFFLNLYNSMVCHGLCAFGAPASNWQRSSFYDRVAYRVGPWKLSLNDIEHGILRGNRVSPCSLRAQFPADDARQCLSFRAVDPRVHFALVCGARGCPAIRIFCPYSVNRALNCSVSCFAQCKDNVCIDIASRTIRLSKLFCWYKTDFGGDGSPDHLVRWLLPFLEGETAKQAHSLLSADAPTMECSGGMCRLAGPPPDQSSLLSALKGLFSPSNGIKVEWNAYDWTVNGTT
jgi:glutaredoxin